MAFNTKEQEIIKWGLNNGKSKQEVEQAINNFRTGVVAQKTEVKEPSFLQGLKTDLDTRVERTGDILDREDSSVAEKGVQLFGQGAGLAANAIEKTVEQIPGVKQTFGAIGSGIQWLANSEFSPAKLLGDQIGKSKALQEVTQLYDTDQNFKDSVDAVANIARLGGDVQMAADAVNFTKNVTSKLGDKVKSAIPPEGGAGALSISSENALKAGAELKNNIQLSIAKKNVNPQLESSANRLFMEGTNNLDNPLVTYDNYLAQSKKALGDIKADPAISVVGEKMGDAFETVIKQRQSVGKVLGEELKANGGVKVSIVEPKTSLLGELKDSGLSYNPKTKKLTSFQGSKFAPEEVKMLDSFLKGVNALGDNPTVAQIDNFIAKTRSTLAFTKGKAGVIGTTNAERIINGGISKLRGALDPTINGNKALSKYWNANKTYSELSDFVDEGSTFLGKKTLSGDFAKDASVAKSSVQSILNQGKKDFMLKLEALTGYKAIDDAVLALQAMKDAGDFRGLSLLQAMSETGIPTSKAGFTQKIIDYAVEKGGKILAGTPEEQTRALLQDLSNKAKVPTTINTKSSTAPTTGAKINKSNQPKSSPTVISKKTTTKSLKGQGEILPTNYKQYSQELRSKIEKEILGDGKKATVIDTDTIKKLHPEYDPKNPMALHEESSALSKEIYEKAVSSDTSGVVKFIGGGAGSGKSEVILNKIGNQPSVVFDGTLARFDSAVKKIDYALSKGKKVEILPVYTPVELATLFNKMRLRNVSDAVLLDTHFGMRNTIPKLVEKYGNKIKVTPYENKVFDPTRNYQGNKAKMSIIEEMKADMPTLKTANEDINGLIQDYGIDLAKKIINDIMKL